ncbi:thioesterase II family protein [Bacillus cereus group sp. MYBK108-2]|uniref:thioesterase II family protein n=1 Tax=unclassified Bacillus cereus group TaxID=2750818 RepID=UPI00288C89F4|nr:alpha/beta fold hydrolase [Bacillus cereus]MDA2307625.1 alpha/beta fold hydrolase [Bacillus cereus]HDX9634242.1 thioesterase [Bacillus cereus]HEF1897129.1 thioesterase [Bacillus cereus]
MNQYFECLNFNEKSSFTLFVLPHAGGTAEFYNDWINYLPEDCNLYALALPGRGKKALAEMITDFAHLIELLTDDIESLLDKPFVFWGHSMGGLIGYELIKSIMFNYKKSPSHFYVSSYPAPHLPNYNILNSDVSDEELINRLIERNGTSSEIMKNKRFLRLILPMLRADYELLNSYNNVGVFPLSCPITGVLGTEDNISESEMVEWKEYTDFNFHLTPLDGDHFYLKNEKNIRKICMLIKIGIYKCINYKIK